MKGYFPIRRGPSLVVDDRSRGFRMPDRLVTSWCSGVESPMLEDDGVGRVSRGRHVCVEHAVAGSRAVRRAVSCGFWRPGRAPISSRRGRCGGSWLAAWTSRASGRICPVAPCCGTRNARRSRGARRLADRLAAQEVRRSRHSRSRSSAVETRASTASRGRVRARPFPPPRHLAPRVSLNRRSRSRACSLAARWVLPVHGSARRRLDAPSRGAELDDQVTGRRGESTYPGVAEHRTAPPMDNRFCGFTRHRWGALGWALRRKRRGQQRRRFRADLPR